MLFRLVTISVVLAFAAQAWAGESTTVPRRLVIAADGVSYYDVQKLQKEGKAFTAFFPVSRDISTFPSLSDIAWADIFRTVAPDGYQRYHYSVGGNRIVGGSLSDLGNPIEYEKKMHMAFEHLPHHLYAYMYAEASAEKEIEAFVNTFKQARGQDEFYVYMLSTDTISHTDSPILPLLKLLSERLETLQKEYEKEHGRKLEIAILSDHGNNHRDDGKVVPFKKFLKAAGYKISNRVRSERDVVFTCAGILTSVAMYTADSQVDPIAELILPLEGVDLVTTVVDGDTVMVRKIGGQRAWIRHKPGTKLYSYEKIFGDPLGYLPAVEKLRAAKKLDADGFADADEWLALTKDHFYPAAVERIYRGHHSVTKNPAKILASLKDGYENANGLVKFMTHFKKRGGTHGALSQAGSDGILLTNFKETYDMTTNRVADFLEFKGLVDFKKREKGARFVDSRVLGVDAEDGSVIEEEDNLGPHHAEYLNLWDPAMPALRQAGVETVYRFVTKHDGFAFFNKKIADKTFRGDSLPHTEDFSEFRIPVELLMPTPLSPGDYFVKVYAERRDSMTGKVLSKKRLYLARFFTDLDGHVLPY